MIANKSVNYAALTRQTKSLSLYVSQEGTPSLTQLIHQMKREDNNKTSLYFDIQKDIIKRQEGNTLKTSITRGTEKLVTKVKDFFHRNEKFYTFEQVKENRHQKVEVTSVQLSPESLSSAVSEDIKRAMMGDKLYNRIYNAEAKIQDSQPLSEELKRSPKRGKALRSGP